MYEKIAYVRSSSDCDTKVGFLAFAEPSVTVEEARAHASKFAPGVEYQISDDHAEILRFVKLRPDGSEMTMTCVRVSAEVFKSEFERLITLPENLVIPNDVFSWDEDKYIYGSVSLRPNRTPA